MKKMRFSRRGFLNSAVLGVVGARLPAGRSTLAAAPTPSSGWPISLAAYSLRKSLTSGEMDLFDFIDWCAEMPLDGVELTSYYFKPDFDNDYLQRLKRRAFEKGLTISGSAVRNNFCLPPGPEVDREIDHVRRWLDHAASLFAPHLRIFAGNVPDGASKSDAIGWVAQAIRELLPHAARRGVVLGLENHGGITARAADHLAICEAVGAHPWFGINLDTGNYRTNPYEELALAAGRAVNVQFKAEIRDQEGESVAVDAERIRSILSQAGYRGWVALEYEAEADPFEEIPRLVSRLREVFG